MKSENDSLEVIMQRDYSRHGEIVFLDSGEITTVDYDVECPICGNMYVSRFVGSKASTLKFGECFNRFKDTSYRSDWR